MHVLFDSVSREKETLYVRWTLRTSNKETVQNGRRNERLLHHFAMRKGGHLITMEAGTPVGNGVSKISFTQCSLRTFPSNNNINNNDNGDFYSATTAISTTRCITATHRIKLLIKRDSRTRATRYVAITTVYKCMPSNNSHITLYTRRNPHSTPATNILLKSHLLHRSRLCQSSVLCL